MDVQQITSELIGTGLTQQGLADLVPCSQATINAYLKGGRGQRPSMEIGMRLLELHSEHCSKQKGAKARRQHDRRSSDKKEAR